MARVYGAHLIQGMRVMAALLTPASPCPAARVSVAQASADWLWESLSLAAVEADGDVAGDASATPARACG